MSAVARQSDDLVPADGSGQWAAPPAPRDNYEPASVPSRRTVIFPRRPKVRVWPVIQAGERRYYLKGTFVVDIEASGDGTAVCVSHRDIPVRSYGRTDEEAISEFAATFDAYWRELVEPDESELTPYAMKIRKAMVAMVEQALDFDEM